MMHGHGRYGRGSDNQKLSFSDLKAFPLHRIWDLVKPHWPKLALATFLMLVVSACGLAGPYLLKLALDEHIANHDLSGLTFVSLLYVGTSLVNWIGDYWQTYLLSFVGQSVIFDMRRRLFGHMMGLDLRFFDKNQAGRLMSRITNDVDAINQLVSSGLTHLVSDTLTIVGIAGIMFYMNWRLALASFVTIPLLLIAVSRFRLRMAAAFRLVRQRLADVNAVLQESISGMRVIQAFSRQESNMEIFEGVNEGTRQANMQSAMLFAAFFPLVEIIGAVGTATVVWYGGMEVIYRGVTVGTVVAFLSYVTRFYMPIREISQVYNMFLNAAVSTERIFDTLDEQPEVTEKPDALEFEDVKGHVRIENVTFGYEPNRPVLMDINVEARPGQTIALVGPTGAGKTSTINLVSRFYDPWEGSVTIDGTDLRDVSLDSLRHQLGTVLQDTFIFSGTIRDNIRYGKLGATDDEVVAAAKAVNAHDFIERLPDGYDTEVKERGSRLSVGQRQLLAFARAVLADPKILILDEATSSVDAYTEVLIQNALTKLLQGRTSIVIAHRLSTIRNADRIYVISDGRVAESGNHHELMHHDGMYKELYDKQFALIELGQEAV